MFEIKNRIIKLFILFIYLVGALLILCGCWDRVEINDLAIVTAAAIDKHEKQIEVSLQVFVPKSMSTGGQGGAGSGGGNQITIVASQKGINMADALSKLQAQLPRKIFWGQCKVFIFGEQIAKEGIQDHLDFLLRDPEPRERAYMFVSEGKAKKMLELQTDIERYSAETMKEIVELSIGLKITLQKLNEMLTSEAKAAALPYLKIMKSGGKEDSKQYPKITGSAIFVKDKMIGDISQKETRGILWLRDEIKGYTVTIKVKDNGTLSLTPVIAQVELTPQIIGNEWIMHIKIQTEGTVVQNNTNFNLTDPNELKVVEEAIANTIQKRAHFIIKKMQTELRADVVEFAKEFHHKYPKQWRKVENHWNEVFPEVKLKFHVKAHIRREGYINKPTRLELEKEK